MVFILLFYFSIIFKLLGFFCHWDLLSKMGINKGQQLIAVNITVENTTRPCDGQNMEIQSNSNLSVYYCYGIWGYHDTLCPHANHELYWEWSNARIIKIGTTLCHNSLHDELWLVKVCQWAKLWHFNPTLTFHSTIALALRVIKILYIHMLIVNFIESGVMLGPPKWAQFCATTRHMAVCDWWRCVSRPCGDTLSPITTHHVASCSTKLC